MSIPGDQSSYEYNILSNLSHHLEGDITQHPESKQLTVEKFVLTTLRSAKNTGMLPGTVVEEIEKSIQHLKARSICELKQEELDSVQRALKKHPSDMLSQAQTTRSWVEVFFPTPSLFLPAFYDEPSNPSPGLSKKDADLLHRVLQDSGYSTIDAYIKALSQAKQACPDAFVFTEAQLMTMNACLKPAALTSSLQRVNPDYPAQFEKDNITSERMTWLTLTINDHKYQLDTKTHITQCIEYLTQVAQNLSPEHSEFLRDCLLLMASQTLLNPLQEGKNKLACSIINTTAADLDSSILPSTFSIKNLTPSKTGCSFTCDVEYNYSYKLKLSASDEDKKGLNLLLEKLGMENIFCGTIQAHFEATLDYATTSFSLHLPQPPVVTVIK
jgi:hypothetical protein